MDAAMSSPEKFGLVVPDLQTSPNRHHSKEKLPPELVYIV
jgi:hypothetical protein